MSYKWGYNFMKKLVLLSSLTVSSALLLSCSSINRTSRNNSNSELGLLVSNAEASADDDIFEKTPKTGEYTHEMAEADADDVVIKKTVGTSEIDKELPDSESDEVPYARNFLSNKKTQRMQFWVDYFTKKERARFQRFINNGEEYRHHIEKIFTDNGLPKELYFVGLIESGYYLGAKSHASAVGPWQFIRGTGSRYGLKITNELDERQDLFKASRAAAMYFKDLHNVFSSWELALSAYNAGEYGIIRRIMKHGTRDFYQLSHNKQLPSETINYVPKVLAAMHVVNNAQKYGFVIPKKKFRLFDLTELKAIKKNVPLKTIAKRLGVQTELLKKLNPELRRDATPRHFAGSYLLRVPKSRYSYRLENLESAPSPVTEQPIVAKFSRPESRKELNRRTAAIEVSKPKFHKIKRGETLISLSRKYEISPRELARMNNFKSWKTNVKVGQKIALTEKQAPVVIFAETPSVKMTNKPIVYQIKRGDNLTDLAKLFDQKLSRIKNANKLKRGHVMVGQKIILPDTKKGIYTVKRGENLYQVAKDLNQPVAALVKLNALKKHTIYAGQKIIVNMD